MTGTARGVVAEGRDGVAGALDDAVDAVAKVWRALRDGPAPVAATYAEGAIGALLHARDALRVATRPDESSRWRARLEEAGILQGAGVGDRLSATLEDMGLRAAPRPDMGADLMRSERIAGLVEGAGFAALLASAVGGHRWIHVSTGATWCGGRSAAEALVRAIGAGRPVPTVGHRELRGTVDAAVAGELATLGWRRIASPALFDA